MRTDLPKRFLRAAKTTIALNLNPHYLLCIYYAFGGQQTSAGELLKISYMLHLSASYFPMPGASGAQEVGFLVFFRDVFPAEQIGMAMFIWRFFSYYLHLIAGPVW
ncbi:MAG: flippase-like domain-containing protein [Clostridia bacterium]|nr:flippase-like domain-containing protein [Clostridia bacterium]